VPTYCRRATANFTSSGTGCKDPVALVAAKFAADATPRVERPDALTFFAEEIRYVEM
jgi:hypothetical protein